MIEFFLGVFSSLLATFVILITRRTWEQWYHIILYKNYPRVSGEYKIKEKIHNKISTAWYPEEKQTIILKQYGKMLRGYFNVKDGDTLKHAFPLRGTVATDRSLLLSYESDNPKYTLKGAILVRFEGLNKEMNGKHIFICLRCEKIHEFDISLKMVNE